ncbi:MAG TPA: hypothetical protein VHF25_03615, partial [Nitriliruptorales bacterium]|nr:hypothetical protein [Nitriliruptorales bacterium]
MTARKEVPIPSLVRDALFLEDAYDFGLGVVLRAPTAPHGTGASASYRIDSRVEPVMPALPYGSGDPGRGCLVGTRAVSMLEVSNPTERSRPYACAK